MLPPELEEIDEVYFWPQAIQMMTKNHCGNTYLKIQNYFSDKSLWIVSAHIPSILPVFMLIIKTKHLFVVVLLLLKNKRQSIIREVQIYVKKNLYNVL